MELVVWALCVLAVGGILAGIAFRLGSPEPEVDERDVLEAAEAEVRKGGLPVSAFGVIDTPVVTPKKAQPKKKGGS